MYVSETSSSAARGLDLRRVRPTIEASPRRQRTRSKGLREDAPLSIDSLDAQSRAALAPVLVDIFRESYGALSFDTIRDELVFRPRGQLTLYRDPADEIVGFVSMAMDTMYIDGRPYGIIQAGTYFRRHCRGAGLWTVWHGAKYCLQYKLRHPLRPVRFVCEALTPPTYRLIARSLPRTYPSRHRPTPESERRVIDHVIDHHHLLRSERPFVVHYPDPASHQDPGRIMTSTSLRDDPDVQFYLERNPKFAEGHILCMSAAVDWRDVLFVLGRTLSRRFRQFRRFWRSR